MILLLLSSLLALALGEECVCTGKNEGLPKDSLHFGTDFGTKCKEWDEKLEQCLDTNAPLWCVDKWCYVKEGCTTNGKVTAVKSTYKKSGLYFSYEVCGNPNRFDEEGFVYNWEQCEERTRPLAVYFAVDTSGSIDDNEWEEMKIFIYKLIKEGLDHPKDAVGVVMWASRKRSVQFNFDDGIDKVLEEILFKPRTSRGSTWTDDAIAFAIKKMNDEEYLPEHKKYLILVTDGEPDKGHGPCDDGDKTVKERMENNNINFAVLAIEGDNPKDFKGTLGCLVEDVNRDIVVMNNFYSFYEYRDPTNGDMCINPEVFRQGTIPPTMKPTPQPTQTESPTMKPTKMPITEKPTMMPSDRPSKLPSNAPTSQPTMKPTAKPTTARPTEMRTAKPTDCQRVDAKHEEPEDVHGCAWKERKECNKNDQCEWNDDTRFCWSVNPEINKCERIRYKSTCLDLTNCQYKDGKCMLKESPTKGRQWGTNKGPHYWATCADEYCKAHVWFGGESECHYETEYGCGCIDLPVEQCLKKEECEFKNCECQMKPKCESLSFDECHESDRCDVWDGGCTKKCKKSKNQKYPENVVLMLDHSDGKCKLHTVYACPKSCSGKD